MAPAPVAHRQEGTRAVYWVTASRKPHWRRLFGVLFPPFHFLSNLSHPAKEVGLPRWWLNSHALHAVQHAVVLHSLSHSAVGMPESLAPSGLPRLTEILV